MGRKGTKKRDTMIFFFQKKYLRLNFDFQEFKYYSMIAGFKLKKLKGK